MSSRPPARVELLQGTLDVLILRTLLGEPKHGHAIAKHIQRTSEELLQVETGSLYPALHRLEGLSDNAGMQWRTEPYQGIDIRVGEQPGGGGFGHAAAYAVVDSESGSSCWIEVT